MERKGHFNDIVLRHSRIACCIFRAALFLVRQIMLLVSTCFLLKSSVAVRVSVLEHRHASAAPPHYPDARNMPQSPSSPRITFPQKFIPACRRHPRRLGLYMPWGRQRGGW